MEIYKNLTWLCEAPQELLENFNSIIADANLDRLKEISKYKLSDSHIKKIYAKHRDILNSKKGKKNAIKLLVVSSNTFDFIAPQLLVAALRNNLHLDISILPFGNIASLLMQGIDNNELEKFDYVLLSYDHKGLNIVDDFNNSKKEVFLNAVQEILTIKNIVNNQLKATLIFQSVIPSTENIFGNMENYLAETRNKIIADINGEILAMSEQSDVLFFNVEETAKRVGLANWYDHRMYYWAKLPFNANFYGIYASKLINLIAADKGLTKKALVLDLDNTLWGGVIGDDGVDGIKATVGDPKGESFLNFQEYCKRLKSRGILLAVCSKNTIENALLPFKENPDMVLHEDDFVVFKANWNNKADNIREIADEMNIGLDSMVFVDDNPTERNLVRKFLPEVSVPEVSDDVSSFPEIISSAGYFESTRFSRDDISRSEDYKLNKKRNALKERSTDISEYLSSLEMYSEVSAVTMENSTRPVQLMLKTNQFNLSNKRRNEKDLESLLLNDNFTILQFRLQDKFADNGVVSVVVLEKKGKVLFIDTWVMSCRVFGRTLEFFIFNEILKFAHTNMIEALNAEYKKTEKNKLILDLLKTLNFKKIHDNKDSSLWELNHSNFTRPTYYIKEFI